MGTARMGADPGRSVVNEWGRSRDVKNLFIVDGSILVTAARVNPTQTIRAPGDLRRQQHQAAAGHPIRTR
jgi:choline dehydrogenase-like flavoprotein